VRRAIPVIVVTVGGLALVANFHTTPAGVPLAAGTGSSRTTTSPGATPRPSSAADRPTTTSRGPIRSDTTTSATSPRTTAPPSSTSTAARTVDGPVITTRYGDVQVRATLNGKRIVDVQPLQLPKDRSRSVRISQNAGPTLRSEALQAQSANINLVSGASYTSEGYIESLQGALDQATP